MQYAIVNGQKCEAFPRGKGECPNCHNLVIAKCGQRNINHWAHDRRQNCDPWWENETAWHREWKNMYPSECREISHKAPDGEIHRCDIKTSTGIFIEVQHSGMSDKERISREDFYGNLVWIIDGRGFKNNFDIYHMLPSPSSNLASDLVWAKAIRNMRGAIKGMFYRLSEKDPDSTMVRICGIREIEQEIEETYVGHHQYDWVYPRKTWLDAKCPIYIDFGDEWLVRLESYGIRNLPCVRLVSKRKFVEDTMREASVSAIGV